MAKSDYTMTIAHQQIDLAIKNLVGLFCLSDKSLL